MTFASDHDRALTRRARVHCRQIRWAVRSAPPRPAPVRALGRVAALPGRLVRWIGGLFRSHWDVAAFDLLFGSIKAFGVYPALFGAGLAWTIPLMEYAPLNTQLWTAAYLLGRRQLVSLRLVRTLGHSLEELEALRDRSLAVEPRDCRNLHRIRGTGGTYVVRLGRGRLREAWRRWRRIPREANVLTLGELRALVGDPEFLVRADRLRSNALLLERVLLERILADAPARECLLARLEPELGPPRDDLAGLVAPSHAPERARAAELGERLAGAAVRRLGRVSPFGLALRWLGWSYQRAIHRALCELERAERRALAEVLDGKLPAEVGVAASVRKARREVDAWMTRLESFATLVRGVRTMQAAAGLATREIRSARVLGLEVRLARTAQRLGPLLCGNAVAA